MNKNIIYNNESILLGRATGYQGVLSMLIGCGVLSAFMKVILYDQLLLEHYIIILVCGFFILLVVCINIKLIVGAARHIADMVISNEGIKIYNYFAFTNQYDLRDVVDVKNFTNENEFIRAASYLSSKHENYRIQFSDGRAYFLNGSSDEAKNIASYLKSRLRVIDET